MYFLTRSVNSTIQHQDHQNVSVSQCQEVDAGEKYTEWVDFFSVTSVGQVFYESDEVDHNNKRKSRIDG